MKKQTIINRLGKVSQKLDITRLGIFNTIDLTRSIKVDEITTSIDMDEIEKASDMLIETIDKLFKELITSLQELDITEKGATPNGEKKE